MSHTILIASFIILCIINSGLIIYQLMNPLYTKMFPLQVKTIAGFLFVILTFLVQLTPFPNILQESLLLLPNFILSIFKTLVITLFIFALFNSFTGILYFFGSHADTAFSHLINNIWLLLGIIIWKNNLTISIGLIIFSIIYTKYLRINKYYS